MQSCSAAVAAHWLVAADSAAVAWELGLAAAVVVSELELVAADAVVSELELVAAGAVAVVSVVEPAAAFQAWPVAAVEQVWPFPVVSLAVRGPLLRFRKPAPERLRL